MCDETGYEHGACIIISKDGDVLKPYDQVMGTADSVRDGVPFKIYVVAGTHVGCGYVDYDVVGDQYGYLLCRKCGLRVTFPATVTTYEELYKRFGSLAVSKRSTVPPRLSDVMERHCLD